MGGGRGYDGRADVCVRRRNKNIKFERLRTEILRYALSSLWRHSPYKRWIFSLFIFSFISESAMYVIPPLVYTSDNGNYFFSCDNVKISEIR